MKTLITNELFLDFIECRYRGYLKITGATEPKSDLLDVSGRLRERYHSQAREHLLRAYRDEGKQVCTNVGLSMVLANRYDLAIDVTATDTNASVRLDALMAAPGNASGTINLQQPDASNGGDNFAGQGTLGSFTVTNVRAIANSPGASSTCSGSNQIFLTELAGAGVFRFQDGSLLEVNLTQGGDCIDLITGVAHCSVTFQITGGTGRFHHASGVLTMTETVKTVAADALGNPVFFAATGGFRGTISGVAREDIPDREKE